MNKNFFVESPYLVPFDGSFRLNQYPNQPPENSPDKDTLKDQLEDAVKEISELQRKLYAYNRYSLLLVFQAMDAAGKDSTIRNVTKGINPAGFQVFSFKQPSKEELDHDFLWRTSVRLPERGRIGIFNRSYYEEVLVVRVHPEYLEGQQLSNIDLDTIWQERFESIVEHERHLARNGVIIRKFFLNISKDEQRKRFIRRIERPDKNWKFSSKDVEERQHWDDYMNAYEQALQHTSTEFAPWYAIPADDKPFMRLTVANILLETLQSLDLHYPKLSEGEIQELEKMRQALNFL